MNFRLLILFLFGIINFGYSQNLNMIIEVNEQLINTEISDLYLSFVSVDGNESGNWVDYHPGELILQLDDWEKIESELTEKIRLTFDYHTFKNNGNQIENFEIEMNKSHFNKRYLILKVYDFREKKYRKLYGCLTDKKFITDFNFPQGGVLIKCQ